MSSGGLGQFLCFLNFRILEWYLRVSFSFFFLLFCLSEVKSIIFIIILDLLASMRHKMERSLAIWCLNVLMLDVTVDTMVFVGS